MGKFQTVRDVGGNIYADVGSAQLRRIPNVADYQSGVSEGLYSGETRQLDTAPARGAGDLNYMGGYEVGGDLSLDDARAGRGNFSTQTRELSPSGTGFANALKNIVKTGSAKGSVTTEAAPARTDQIGNLRKKVADVQQQAFERSTEYTPENLRHLSPSQQAELRRQRVTALSAEMGNYNAAIQILQDEEEAAKSDAEKERTYALEALNTYLQYGVLDQLSEEDQASLVKSSGMSINALKKINDQAKNGQAELREGPDGNLYAFTWNAEKGKYETEMVLGGAPVRGGGPNSSAALSGSGLTPEQVTYYTNLLNARSGSDGYADTSVYRDAYNQIASMTGTKAAAEFASRFSGRLNPSDPSAVAFSGIDAQKASSASTADYSYGASIIAANPGAPKQELIAALISSAGFSAKEAADFVKSD